MKAKILPRELPPPRPKPNAWNETIQEIATYKYPRYPKKELGELPDNIEVALAAIECLERLSLAGLTGTHAARYLRSIVQAVAEWQVDPASVDLPHPLDPATSPLLNLLIGDRTGGKAEGVRAAGSGGSISVNRKARRKPGA